MEIRNTATDLSMTPGLDSLLRVAKSKRDFSPSRWVDAKCSLLNAYLRKNNLKSVVVAVSGGIDSAVVLALAKVASKHYNSPIQKIIAISLPSLGTAGVTGQETAQSDAQRVADSVSVPLMVVNMNPIVYSIETAVELATGLKSNTWAEGQVVSYARTPTYYYVTSLLAANGLPGVVLGTTNLSEGGYLGYFGKASDGMVDLQMISDIYKSEVYDVARHLGLPQEIIDKEPTGDMFDAAPDEVVFGAPYDFVELYQEHLRMGGNPQVYAALHLKPDDFLRYREFAGNLERMHAYNAHKYLGRSPAVHLDIMPCAVPGGWNNEPPPLEVPPVQFNKLVNLQTLSSMSGIVENDKRSFGGVVRPSSRQEVHILDTDEIVRIKEELATKQWVPVPKDGIRIDHDLTPEEIGSYRLTAYAPDAAEALWRRLKAYLPAYRTFTGRDETDHGDHPVWKPVGVSPVFRFIKYTEGGELIPHYDSPYVENDRRQTMMSLVCYIEAPKLGNGGRTLWVKNPEKHLPVSERNLSDWTADRPFELDKDYKIANPYSGLALLFDHRILHAGEKLKGGDEKIIFRTDVIFERCDWYLPR